MRRNPFAAKILTGVLLVMIAHVSGTNSADAQQTTIKCGSFYRVQAGDTLRAITLRTYPHDRYEVVFAANRDVLANPAQIEVGQLLFLPCEGAGPRSRAEALLVVERTPTTEDQRGTRFANETPVTQATAQSVQLAQTASLPKALSRGRSNPTTSAPGQPIERQVAVVSPQGTSVSKQRPGTSERASDPILMLSAAGLEPLAGPGLDGGGLVGELIQASLRETASSFQLEPAFVNDRAAHLDVLLPLDDFGLSYPWPAPDCNMPTGAHSAAFCKAFDVSLPIFQVEMRILARSGDPEYKLTSNADIRSLGVCRPQDFPPFDLESQRISKITLGEDLRACLELLASGDVDLISTPAIMMRSVQSSDEVVEIEALRRQEPVHAVFQRGSSAGERLRSDLNNGLEQLQRSGNWFRIVSDYLRRFNAALPRARS